jgi:Asp-tRNA(Asn)/Glu-tRNA(Gln) amidotransferase B subunit
MRAVNWETIRAAKPKDYIAFTDFISNHETVME